jgi:small GTP-binding protein
MKVIEIEEKTVKLTVWDSAGQERFRTITQQFYKNCDGIILAYDITDRASFNAIELWIKQVREHVDKNFPLILIGNKNDMNLKRSITIEEGRSLGKTHNVPFFETSAKHNNNVSDVFNTIVNLLINLDKTLSCTNVVNLKRSRSDEKINRGRRFCCK